MPIFKKQQYPHYLITNYKVMYSTLKRQKNLQRINLDNGFFKQYVLSRFLKDSLKMYLVVRDPYNRIASFFKEKFRKSVNSFEEKGYWQNAQKIFFPFLGLHDTDAPLKIKETLLATSFEEMVAIMPKVYTLNGHLHPQYYKVKAVISIFGIPIKYRLKLDNIFKIESQSDLDQLAQLMEINLKAKVNTTATFEDDIIWTTQVLNTINKIYAKDFELFDYPKKRIR